jgi:hypothetical protein
MANDEQEQRERVVEAARNWLKERGTDKPYTKVAEEWREHEWTPEDCVRFAAEITVYLADFALAHSAGERSQVQAYKDACGDLSPVDLEKLLDKRFDEMGVAQIGEVAEAVNGRIKELETEITELQRRLDEAERDAKSWKHHWQMYRDAWVRELGGWTIPKAHEIDSLVLTTRKRCVNPLLGNCVSPHWLGKPTEDGKALQQTPHPQDSGCRNWKADSPEANPRAEAAEAEAERYRLALERIEAAPFSKTMREIARQALSREVKP